MHIADLQHGKIVTLDLVPLTDIGLEKIPPNRWELVLTQIGNICALSYTGQEQPLIVAATDSKSQWELQRLISQETPRLCWLVGVRSDRNQVVALTIQIHEFSERVSLPELKVGVDEKLVSDMGRQLARRFSIEAACAWLADELLIAPGPMPRAILVGRPDAQSQQRRVFRLLGSRFALDVEQHEGGGWRGFRLTRPKTALTPEEYRPIILAEGGFAFIDQTVAGQMRQGMATELDQIVRKAGSYMSVWSEYQSMEARRLLQEARRFGWLSYDGCHRLPDGRWIFQLTAESQWTPAQLNQAISEDRSLEASKEIPELLTNDSPIGAEFFDAQNTGREKSRAAFRGTTAGSDTHSIFLRPDSQDGEPTPPPERGYIHVSLRGDLTRMQRQRKAHTRIATGQTSIPQLVLLLENRPVLVRRTQPHEPLSSAAKAKFHSGLPTPRQVDAIRVALNTPDIAIIQGPPGTGKTRTIAAIIERLTEIAKEQDVAFDRVLLTSFQHDAVENAAAITEIFGLPAMKVGRRRGGSSDNVPLQAWTRKTTAALEADMDGRPTKPLRKLLELLRMKHASYVQSPGTETEAARMLLEIGSMAREHLSAPLVDRIAAVANWLKLGVAGLDDDSRDGLQAVRGLRIQESAFADDGPRMAWRVLEKFAGGSLLSSEDHALLEKAKDWQSPSPLDFLPQLESLKNRLLDLLQAKTPPTRTPLVNAEVVSVLDELVTTLETRVRDAVDEGPDMVLEQLIGDIKNDPVGLREAVQRYTVVLAATCQQAVSNQMVEVLSDDVEFENVIVDEAARASPLDLLIPMSLAARRIILVGDHRQLPHLLEPEVERELELSVREETRDQIRKSLFERLFLHVKNLEAQDGIKRWVTLDTQYRMHPVLGSFVSDAFYRDHGEDFLSPLNAEANPRFVHGLGGSYEGKLAVWKNLPHTEGGEERAGYSWRRICEAEWIAAETRRLLEESPGLSVGIISFYAAQVEAIKDAMQREELTTLTDDGSLIIADAWRRTVNSEGEACERLRVGTVDAFQGKEFDIVFLSLTRSNRIQPGDEKSTRRKFGHLLLENRLCVAMSRQKRLLITVGDSAMASEVVSKLVPGLHAFLKLCRGGHGTVL